MPLGVEKVLKSSGDIAHGWNNVFLLSALVSLVGGQLFLVFGSGKNQNYGADSSQQDTKDNLTETDSRDDVFIADDETVKTVTNSTDIYSKGAYM